MFPRSVDTEYINVFLRLAFCLSNQSVLPNHQRRKGLKETTFLQKKECLEKELNFRQNAK